MLSLSFQLEGQVHTFRITNDELAQVREKYKQSSGSVNELVQQLNQVRIIYYTCRKNFACIPYCVHVVIVHCPACGFKTMYMCCLYTCTWDWCVQCTGLFKTVLTLYFIEEGVITVNRLQKVVVRTFLQWLQVANACIST